MSLSEFLKGFRGLSTKSREFEAWICMSKSEREENIAIDFAEWANKSLHTLNIIARGDCCRRLNTIDRSNYRDVSCI